MTTPDEGVDYRDLLEWTDQLQKALDELKQDLERCDRLLVVVNGDEVHQ